MSWLRAFAPQSRWRELRQRQQRFREERQAQPQSDATFLERIAADNGIGWRRLALLIRAIVASQCGVAADQIRAEDRTAELESLIGQRGLSDFLLAIPEGLEISDFFFQLTKAISRSTNTQVHVNSELRETTYRRWREPDERGFAPRFGPWVSWLATEIERRSQNGPRGG
jgi:hypothetical protein